MHGSLKLRQLRLLVAMDDLRKLQLAAESLSMSQSAASKMLTEIETIAGVPLFERTARGVTPTDYGLILIRGGRSMLAHLDKATDELAGYKAGAIGSVAVGAVAGPSVDLFIEIMNDLGTRLDKINISLEVATSPPLINKLIALELDFVAARLPEDVDPQQFEYYEVGDEEMRLIVRAEHPLAGREHVDIEEMVDVQWICQRRGSFLRKSIERLFRSHGAPPPHRVIETDSFLTALAIAARTDTIVAVPMLVLDLIDLRRFSALHFGEKLMLESYGIVKLKNRVLSPAAMVVFEAMKRCRVSSLSASDDVMLDN